MNALCNSSLDFVSIHPSVTSGRVSASEERHGLRLSCGLVTFLSPTKEKKNLLYLLFFMEKTTTLSVHRCRFVDYAPSAITALAFPPLPLPSVKGKKKTTAGKQSFKFGLLAVGHANGNIDLCQWMGAERQIQCSQAWVVRKVCYSFFFYTAS